MPDLSPAHYARFEINLGSNILRNSNGVLTLQGREQLVIECALHQLLLTMDFFDETGQHTAHLRRNRWAFNTRERYILHTSSPTAAALTEGAWLKVLERQTGTVVLELTSQADARVELVNGHFYTHRGELVEITPHVCRIGTSVALFGDIRECRGGSVRLG